jgi:hypothetical protein
MPTASGITPAPEPPKLAIAMYAINQTSTPIKKSRKKVFLRLTLCSARKLAIFKT